MRVLVIVEDYCTENNQSLAYVHSRNVMYKAMDNNIDIMVLSFRARNNYCIDGIKVITYSEFKVSYSNQKFDILISHAPNIKHHISFLLKYNKSFQKIVFFFHGHEALRINKYYPEPYDYLPQSKEYYKVFRNIYDCIKLYILKITISLLYNRIWMIFVSKWMMDEFIINMNMDPNFIKSKSTIIYNSVNSVFEENRYDPTTKKEGDFITIRSNLDGSKYAIDIVLKIAFMNPDKKFHIIGKGDFFKHNIIPQNVTYEIKHLKPDEIPSVLNKYNYALMPSRLDAQGVMACEMATFGIPLITSDIRVFKEVFENFDSVYFIENEGNYDIASIIKGKRNNKIDPPKKFYAVNTILKEIEIFREILSTKR